MKIWPMYEVTFEFDEFTALMTFLKNTMPKKENKEDDIEKVLQLSPGQIEKLRRMYNEMSVFLPK